MCGSGHAGMLAVIEGCVFWCLHTAGAWETFQINIYWNITLHV